MAATDPSLLRVLQPISGNTGKIPISRFTTANMRGPYIDAGHATNFPTANFLDHINDPDLLALGVPRYLRQSLEYPQSVDPWQQYLCIALARHFSYYRGFTGSYTDGDASPSLRDKYRCFKKFFIVALDTARGATWTGRRLSRNGLVELDWMLMRDAFRNIPALFEKCFQANGRLVQELHNMTTNGRVQGAPDPEIFLQLARMKLGDEWIGLGNVEDVLENGSVLAEEGETVRFMRVLLEERWSVLDDMAYVRRLMAMAAASGDGSVQGPMLEEALGRTEDRFGDPDGDKENIAPAAEDVRAVERGAEVDDWGSREDSDVLGIFRWY